MDDVQLPMKRGTMEDINREDEPSSVAESGSQDTPMDSMSSQGAKAIYAKEAHILINYDSLEEDDKEVGSSLSFKSH